MAKREEVEEVQSRIEHLENKLDILLNVIYEDSIARSRARTKLKLETRETIESLKREKSTLNEKVQELIWELSSLQTRKEEVSKALQIEEQTLYQKLYNTLNNMKDQKPELFHISVEEQIAKITFQLAGSFLRWLVSE